VRTRGRILRTHKHSDAHTAAQCTPTSTRAVYKPHHERVQSATSTGMWGKYPSEHHTEPGRRPDPQHQHPSQVSSLLSSIKGGRRTATGRALRWEHTHPPHASPGCHPNSGDPQKSPVRPPSTTPWPCSAPPAVQPTVRLPAPPWVRTGGEGEGFVQRGSQRPPGPSASRNERIVGSAFGRMRSEETTPKEKRGAGSCCPLPPPPPPPGTSPRPTPPRCPSFF
jgi:hypothetical protein